MSKTVTLETAKSLKAAFDAAGIEMPETEQFWWFGSFQYPQKGMITHALISAKDKRMNGGILQIPAPDAEELGKWLPVWQANDWTFYPQLNMRVNGWWANFHTNYNDQSILVPEKPSESQCEAWASLLLRCLKADPEQIKKHLSK